MILLLLKLFWSFFLIGLFTFGGGYAVVGMIQSEIVISHGWLTESSFTDIVAISQMTPGPIGLNCSTYVGYEVMKQAGFSELIAAIGSVTTSIAVVLPSFVIMILIVRFYAKFHTTRTFSDVLSGLRPAVAGLIGAAAFVLAVRFSFGEGFSLVTDNFPDWKSWALAGAAFLCYTFLDAGPLQIIGGGALLGIIINQI
ncbi:MAG: chromate transporter [Bacteroidales bacterium]|nr:chromate transporter [Bacteroidales bacterium]